MRLLVSALFSAMLWAQQGPSIQPRFSGPVDCRAQTIVRTDTAFTAASTTANVALFTLPGGSRVIGTSVEHSAQFSDGTGPMTDVSVSVGSSTGDTDYSTAWSIGEATAVANTTLQNTDAFKATTKIADALHAHLIATGSNFGSPALSITGATTASPTELTSTTHGLQTGNPITISGATGIWAGLNANWTVTRTGANTFTVPFDASLAGTVTEAHGLLTFPIDFTNAVWIKTRSSITASAANDPNGMAANAQKFVEDSQNGRHEVEFVPATPIQSNPGVSMRAAVYLKKAERDKIRLRVIDNAAQAHSIDIDLTAGTAASSGGSPTSITMLNVGNGWYRASFLFDSGVGAPDNEDFGIAPLVGGTSTYQGDGTSGFYLWGASLSIPADNKSCSSATVGSPTTVTCNLHGITTGDLVTFSGITGILTALNSSWVGTNTGANTMTVPYNSLLAGTVVTGAKTFLTGGSVTISVCTVRLR